MLAVQRRSGTAFLSASTTSVRSFSARRNACSSPTPGRSTVNSSPPIRPTVHFSGPAVRRRVPTTAFRNRSAAGRPTSRLSAYIPSRSIAKNETVPSFAVACAVARPKAGASRSAAFAVRAACRFAIPITSLGDIYIGLYMDLSSGLSGRRPRLDWVRQAPRGHPPRASARTPAPPATRRGRSRTVRGGIERGGPLPAEVGWYRGPTGRPMEGRSFAVWRDRGHREDEARGGRIDGRSSRARARGARAVGARAHLRSAAQEERRRPAVLVHRWSDHGERRGDGHPSRLVADVQGRLPAVPGDARQGPALPERLRLPGPLGRGAGRAGAQPQQQA